MASAGSPADILSVYTEEVARYKLLTIPEEQAIGARAMAGDEVAQTQLVNANLRFVINVAKKYKNHGVPLMDLIQAGNIGLHHAAKKFDPSRNVRFISYAVFWVQQQIQKELDQANGSVRATQTQLVRLRRIRKLQAEARQRLGRDLTEQELVQATGFTVARVREALGYRVTIKSLDEPVNPSDGTTTTLAQIIGHDDGRDAAEVEAELHAAVQRVMQEVLSERERIVLQEYYGFFGKREMSLTEIGAVREISRERARQLKERALRKLRNAAHLHPVLKSVFTPQDDLNARRTSRGLPPILSERLDEDMESVGLETDDELEAAGHAEAPPHNAVALLDSTGENDVLDTPEADDLY